MYKNKTKGILECCQASLNLQEHLCAHTLEHRPYGAFCLRRATRSPHDPARQSRTTIRLKATCTRRQGMAESHKAQKANARRITARSQNTIALVYTPYVYIYMCICIYTVCIYIYILYIYICIYTYVYICCIYMYIYVYTVYICIHCIYILYVYVYTVYIHTA